MGPSSPAYGVTAIRQAKRFQLMDRAVVFIGDNQIASLATSELPGKSENFDIAKNTLEGAISGIATYRLDKARHCRKRPPSERCQRLHSGEWRVADWPPDNSPSSPPPYFRSNIPKGRLGLSISGSCKCVRCKKIVSFYRSTPA